eukprot:gnl/TRDRNA2_/TRDRNA2_185114_c0_seq1.p1 gnl/TRDRNA2_/TRDRNA2_185114_c0~~gnl/TRDRNA2_/TRDRNA2_185114_c0_seq1.p1  ORF type:complete len:387 (-),score=64.35 gnl/TRDRNA2_/TRDRNA2_185114_c0_seq1:123-1283(-)
MLRAACLLCTLANIVAAVTIEEALPPPSWYDMIETIEPVAAGTTIDLELFPSKNGTETDKAFADFPGERMPMNMAAWPKVDGRPGPCPDYTIVEDSETGWENNCRGLVKTDIASELECKAACVGDSMCATWQYNTDTGCHVGGGFAEGNDCDALRTSFPNLGGQRIVHGQAVVLLNLKADGAKQWKDEKAVFVGKFKKGTEVIPDEEGIKHCKGHCEADITCEFWWYFKSEGCYIENVRSNRADMPANNQTTFWDDDIKEAPAGMGNMTEWNEDFLAGEYLQHQCVEQSAASSGAIEAATTEAPPPAPDHTWVWILLGGVLALLGALAAAYYFLKPQAAPKKRAVKVKPDPYVAPKVTSAVQYVQAPPTVVYTMPVQTYAAPAIYR